MSFRIKSQNDQNFLGQSLADLNLFRCNPKNLVFLYLRLSSTKTSLIMDGQSCCISTSLPAHPSSLYFILTSPALINFASISSQYSRHVHRVVVSQRRITPLHAFSRNMTERMQWESGQVVGNTSNPPADWPPQRVRQQLTLIHYY